MSCWHSNDGINYADSCLISQFHTQNKFWICSDISGNKLIFLWFTAWNLVFEQGKRKDIFSQLQYLQIPLKWLKLLVPLEKSCFRLPGWLVYSFTDENHKVSRWPESSLTFCLLWALWQTYCAWRAGEIKRPSWHGGKHADTAHKGKPQLHGIEVTVKCNSNESFHNSVKPINMPVFPLRCLISFTLPCSSFVQFENDCCSGDWGRQCQLWHPQ